LNDVSDILSIKIIPFTLREVIYKCMSMETE